ncbi:uncharacterized protein EV422DRAFT_354579 [Fimicolochytrium jonesii]|uniref:uncharacterized protein n=1 Tax=Fimicolochytrium jonesii TaxID=1396493 RepID=UPI0022FE9B05|nr:uncharacterized protein EV422DRAFT_354579 [Fimicolochytrium jonesii]KAI8823426.1 hypothetical protein EV422DRAFT_354579 [Fimicolochytrium jonesii]
MSDEKRAERLLKRAKPFLDEKLKAKQRLTALSSFVENSNVQEQQKFFHEHDYQIYTVMFDCFTHQVDKIKTREKPDKPVSINSKEVADLLRSLQILKKIIVYLPEKMRAGWQRRSIVGILQALLVTGNHVKLRIEGLRLLLLYLAQQPPEVQDTIPLYANAISLSVFDAFVIPPPIATAHTYCENQGIDSLLPTEGVAVWKGEGKGQLNQDVIEWERRIHTLNGPASVGGSGGSSTMDRTVLLPSSTPFTIYDAMDMFEEILSHLVIVAGETPATQSTATASLQVPSVRGHRGSVVEKVHPEAKETEVGTDAPNVSTPSVSRNGSLAATDTTPAKSILDISAQPADGLSIMWGHFRNHYLRLLFPQVARLSGMQVSDEEGFATCPPQLLHALLNFLIRNCVDSSVNTSSTSLRRLLLSGDVQNLELVHEWIHQAMLLPYVWSDVMRGAIAIVRVWCAQADEERPPFLQMFSPEAVSPVEGPGGDVDSYLRRYIRYLRLAFSVKVDDVEHMDHQLAIFREVIFLFRSFTLDTMQPSLTPQSWHTLFATLFDVTVHLLCRPSPTAVVRDSAMAIEIADLLLETAFITAVRSGIKDDDLWSTLRSILQRCTRWAECIGNWETTLTTLTTILATHTYSVELDPLHQLKHRANQNAASASPSTHIGHHPPHRAPASVSSFVTHHSSSSSKRDRSNSFIANTLHRGADAKKRANTEVSSNSLKGARSDPEVFVGGGKSQTAESPRTWGLGAFGTSKRDVDRHVEGEETVGEALVLNKRTFAVRTCKPEMHKGETR